MSAVLWGGLACGVLDITAALVVYSFFGAKPIRLLQGIASGLLGRRAFDRGFATAMLGLICHFFIAFSAAAVYLSVSRVVPFVLEHTVLSGVLYAVVVYFVMNHVVVPLSAAAKRPFFPQDDGRRPRHSRVLRRAAYRSRGAKIFSLAK